MKPSDQAPVSATSHAPRFLGPIAISGYSALTGTELTLAAAEVSCTGDWIPGGPVWILPGFMDAHRHFPHGPTKQPTQSLRRQRYDSVSTARSEGVSRVVDMGVGLLEPWFDRPTWVRTALRGIDGRSGNPNPFAATATSPAECGELVAETAEAGADFVKIFATGTGKYSREVACEQHLSEKMIAAAAEAARAYGLGITAHCQGGPAVGACIDAGVASLEHGIYLTQADVQKCAASGTSLTLTPGVYVARHGDFMRERLRELIRDVLDVGLQFAVGTDTGSQSFVDQLLLLLALGMPTPVAVGTGVDSDAPTCHLLFEHDPMVNPNQLLSPVAVVT